MKQMLVAGLVSIGLLSVAWAQSSDVFIAKQKVEKAMSEEFRSANDSARDRYRHPAQTLAFFGLRDDMTVMEIFPGAGWYTELLAPVLRDHGQLIAVSYDTSIPDQPEYRYRLDAALRNKLAEQGEMFGNVDVHGYSEPASQSLGEDGSVDLVLTFRNLHGWLEDGIAKDIFADFHAVLKAGGRLGVVQHRAVEGSDVNKTAPNGYVSEAVVIALAKETGFELAARAEINANSADTRDHPEGVWTLPPSLGLGDKDREKYLAIGESDRMTLLFEKQ